MKRMKKIKAFLTKSKLRQPLWLIAICLFVVWAIIGYKYQFTYNHGESMEPTHYDGDWIIVEKAERLRKGWSPDRFDVVVILDGKTGDKLCKRVMGLPGDTVEIKGGVIYINGKDLEDPFGHGKISLSLVDADHNDLLYWNGLEKGQPVIELVDEKLKKIPEKNVWIIGDNRSLSWYGILGIEDIVGLVIL